MATSVGVTTNVTPQIIVFAEVFRLLFHKQIRMLQTLLRIESSHLASGEECPLRHSE